jgi:hypothetical protein
VQAALTDYRFPANGGPVNAGHLRLRLADFYVTYQPALELVWLVADRAFAKLRRSGNAVHTANTQETLAEFVGVESTTVGRWECGETCPQPWCRGLRYGSPWLRSYAYLGW